MKVGVTGGIGSGKSTICSILEHLGFPVFYSDAEAKKILESNEDVKTSLISLFGNEVFTDGKLNKILISKKIFENQSLLGTINSIVHPLVRSNFEAWSLSQNSKVVFNEAAILFETGSYKTFDKTILVTCPEELRIKRVMERDSVTKEQVLSRIKNQWSDQDKTKLASFVVINDEKHSLLVQIEKFLSEINVLD